MLKLQNLKLHLRNIPGWKTSTKIVVFESDDWGSIRMPGKTAYEKLIKSGIGINDSHFIANDSLESNSDLEMLFGGLSKHKDKTDRNPVFTAACLVANPDFEKIKESWYSEYIYEPFTKTCERYPEHDRVYSLWLKGLKERLFVPVFHGREHLNVQRWMRALKAGNKELLSAFDNGVFGISKGINGKIVPEHLAAFDNEFPSDISYMEEVLHTGTELFGELCGYRARYFVPPNSPGFNGIEKILKDCGLEYICSGRMQSEPLGNGEYVRKFHRLGERNSFGQIYITRNCFFEPVINEPVGKSWINDCLREIEIAFRWQKPAIVSTHRVNYTGFINPENRAKGLKALDELLKKIINRWPEVEFM
ncbi:MAG: hypothetical protein C0408_10020, partial [Odoribacter sp.]|nr:hypothetical protein [Odoribacter sp.]